jgi:hypothetical protein
VQKLLFFFFFVISILFVSQSAIAVSLSSNGDVHTVTQGNLTFVTDPSGLVKLFKNDNYLASVGFTLKGTVNAQQKFLNSWSTDWTWQILSNTDSNVTVLASNTWQGLDWKQRWFFSDTEQKFTNYLTNNTGFDVTNTSFYYVVRFDETNVSCLDYIDNTGAKKNYCFEQDKTITQNLGQYLKRIRFVDTLFNFQDLVDSGFEFNYLFAGQLNNVKSSLAGKGFIIGVTKNGGLFPNGASVILDPTINNDLTSSTNIPIFGTGTPSIFRVNSQNLGVSASPKAEVVFGRYYETTDNGLNWSTADFNFYTTASSAATISTLYRSDNKKIFSLFINPEWDNDIHFIEGDFDNDSLTRTGWDANIALGFGLTIDVERYGADLNSGNWLNVCGGEVGGADRVRCRFVDTDLNTSDITNWSALESSFNFEADVQDFSIYNDSNSNLFALYSVASGQEFRNIRLKMKYDVNGSWSNDLNISGDLNADLQWRVTGSSFVETSDGNLVVLMSAQNGAASNDATVLRFCDDGAEACISDLSNWDTYENVYDGNFLFWGSLATDTNNNVYMIGTDCQNGFCNTDSGLGYKLFFDLNKSVSAKRFIADNNAAIDTTKFVVTRNSDENGLIDIAFLSSDGTLGTASLEYFQIFGDSNSSIISASFTTTPVSPIALDPEEGITNIQVDLNSTTEFLPDGRIVDINYLWQIDGEEISTDQNLVRDFNGSDADFNLSLIVSGNDGVDTITSQNDQNILLRTAPQGIDINFAYNDFANNVDMNFGVTATGTINFAVWGGTDFDTNLLGIDINKTYTTDGIKEVCVIVNGAGDVNKLHCENFTSTRVLVKRPLDKVSGIVLTPFDVATNDITRQLYSAQTLDLNVFLFFESGNDQNILFTIDGNADYFSSTFLIQTNDTNTFQTIQPLLVLISESVSAVFHIINAITQNTIPDVVIESRQGGVLIESTITDSTGSAVLNFIVADTYDLTFIFQGVVSLEQQIRPIDTEYFIYLFLEQIITEPQDPESITVTFDPSIGQVQEGTDGNFTLTQIVTADRSTITQINIQVDQNGLLFFDQNFTGVPSGGTFSQDFNASSFDSSSTVNVTVRVTSSLIDETKKSISYFIQFTSQVTFLNAINDLGINLGDVGRIVLVVLSSFVVIGGFAQATRNPHILGTIVIIWLGMFTAIGLNENYVVWVPVPVFLFATVGAVAIYLNR